MFNVWIRSAYGLLAIFFIVLVAGCGTKHAKDGPPNFYVDESKIPNAVPKVEPLSRIGNKPFYTVFGRRYFVMPSSKNYEEEGVASWYGTKFNAHHTSNGEKYDMLAMTAAHKSLPLPTYVEVTNLNNHRKVIVKVNDRGPFEANRLIDLSYVAAKKLGMLGHGTTHVNVRAIDPLEAFQHRNLMAKRNSHHLRHFASSKQAGSVSAHSVYLQVGAFRNKSHAIRLQHKLIAMFSSPVEISRSNTLYHVKIGPIKDTITANIITKRLRTLGLNSKRYSRDFELA